MNVPVTRALIPVAIIAAFAVLLALNVISLTSFLWAAGTLAVASVILLIVSVAGPHEGKEKRHSSDINH